MKTILKYLITVFFAVNITIFTAHAATWRSKPVQCGSIAEVKRVIEENDEIALIGGLGNSSFNDENLRDLTIVPVYWFYSPDTGSFSVVEFHLESDEACVIQFGNGVDFDVAELFTVEEKL